MMSDFDQFGGSVLIAETEEDLRVLLSSRARNLGLDVEEARDPSEALKALRDRFFDVLIVNVSLGEASGIEVFKEGRKLDPDLQALVLAGEATTEIAIDALRAGAFDFITNPLDSISVFDRSLLRVLEHRKLLEENKRLFAEVELLAVTDPLTGLYNRRKLEEALGREIERAGRYQRPLSLIMLDVDNLKAVNDRFGHQAGDEVLRHTAAVIREQIRGVDIATRYGGDEFMIVLPEAGLEEATLVAKRIISRIPEVHPDYVEVSISLGVVQWGPGFASLKELLHQVDRTLYEAKEMGKGRIEVFQQITSGSSQ